MLTAVHPATPDDEAVRDLARARDDAREDRQLCRHRLGKLLLRRGLHCSSRNWTRGHRQWIDSLTCRAVVDVYLLAIDHAEARVLALNARLAAIAGTDPYREPVGRLRCFRGIDTRPKGGGAFGAPGHRGRHVARGSYARKLTLAGYGQATLERSRLDRGSFHISFSDLIDTAPALPAAQRFAAHLTAEFRAIFALLWAPEIDATNWRAEPAIRPAVVTRKVCGGTRTRRGAETQQVLASLARTPQQRSLNLDALLTELLCAPRPIPLVPLLHQLQ